MNPVQYILLDRTLPMSTGKAAAQASHAAVEGFRLTPEGPELRAWLRAKQYAKVVLEVDDIQTALAYITNRGFKAELIIDEGRTEFGGKLTPTAIGCEIVDKDWAKVREVFGVFDLYGTHDDRSIRLATRPPVAERYHPGGTLLKAARENCVGTPVEVDDNF